MKASTQISKEHKKGVDKAINYILKNISGDLSLEMVSEVASYSPIHFQKLFKQVIGDSPKQYINKLRLETAIHLLLIQPQKSISEIAEECGFSSPAVFSRSFRSYFAISAEEVRLLSPADMELLHKKMQFKFDHEIKTVFKKLNPQKIVQVIIKKLDAIKGIHLIVPFGDEEKMEKSFQDTQLLAEVNDLVIDNSKICGILNPHQGYVYKTLIAVTKDQKIPAKLFITEIKSGRYATIKVKGDFKNTVAAGKYFFHEWLPESGYKVADNLVFELFTTNPNKLGYNKTEREICIPVELI